MLYMKTIFTQYFSLIFITLISFCSIAQLTPNGNSGSSTTVYTNGASNNPIYIWCADGLSNNTASLTANAPTASGPFTYSWFFHDQSNFSWSPYFTQTGTSSTISNLPSDGYRVQIYNAGGNLVACYIAWVWNMNSDVTANNTPTACNASNLSGAVSVNGAFSYYNPPPPESLINASTQITVCFSANHTYVSDLGFYLVGPAACGSPTIAVMPHPELINASNNCCCNSGDNLTNLCFTTNPLGNINPCSAVVPLNGTYSGYSSSFGNNVTINWSSLFGCNAAEGGWRVQIYDCIAADVGALTNASITFSNLTSICGSPTSITYSSGAINSIINDNSCTAASASIFQVPITPNLTTPITINAATTYLWTANQTVLIPNASSSLNTSVSTIPNGTTNFTLTATISYGSTVCANNAVTTFNNTCCTATADAGADFSLCTGANSQLGTQELPNMTYLWSPATGLSDATIAQPTLTLINSGSTPQNTIYTLTVTNIVDGGCNDVDDIIVTVNPNITPIGLACYETAIFNNSTCVWDVTGTQPVQPTVACYETTTFNTTSCTWDVTGTPPSPPTFLPLGSFCSGTTIPALPTTSTNGVTGTWSPPINNTATTTYTFTPATGQCATNQIMSITIDPSTTTGSVTTTICEGSSYTWPANGLTYTTAQNGLSFVTGCNTATLNITITPNTIPTFSAVGPYCIGEAIADLSLTSTNGINGTWSPAIDNTATTTYTFSPTSTATPICATTVAATISINTNTIPTFAAVGPYCSGAIIPNLPLTSTNGISGAWSPAIDNTATTTYTFTPTSSATPTCATTAALTITIFPNTIPTFAAVGPYCTGQVIADLSLTSSNGINGTWSPAIDNIATTTYTFTPTSTATPTCATTAALSITITPNTSPIFTAVGPYCSGVIIPNLPLTSTNGISGAWSPAIDNTATTTYTFTPTSTATPTCATTVAATISINTNTTPIFDPVGPYCSGAIIPDLPLTSANGITGTWSPAINNTATTTYTFTPTSTASPTCATTAALTIIINPNPTVSFIPGATIGCLPFETSLTNTTPNAQNCVWTISNGIVLTGCGSIPVIFSNDGCFDVTLTTTVSNGCTSSLTMNNLICVENNPIASFSISTNDLSILNTEVLFDNTSTGANTYQWYFGVNDAESSLENPIFTFPNDYENGQYEVILIATSTIGCTDTAETIIQINEELLFYIPNTFTPDGDVYNQTFKPVFTSGFDPYNYEMLIFNRWGEILFETHDVTYGWDGKYALKNCQEGIYSYKITFKNPILDERKVVCGSINLLK